MPVGRPPKPTERKRLTGNPGRRPLPDAGTVVVLPALRESDTPPGIGEHGKALWRQVLSQTSWVGQCDHATLEALARAWDRMRAMEEQLDSNGMTLVDDNGKLYAHPLLRPLGQTRAEVTKLLSLLGITPTDRARLGLAEVKARSKLEEIRARRAAAR